MVDRTPRERSVETVEPSRSSALVGDLTPEALRAHLHRVADWIADYRATIEQRPIVPAVRPGDIAARCPADPPDAPTSLDHIVAEMDTVVMPGIVHWGHPAFLGYFGSTSNGAALVGEMIAAALNVSAMTWQTSPAATELETVVLGWIRRMIGLPDGFTGVVYDTASIAVLHALAAAREGCGVEVREQGVAGRTGVAPSSRVCLRPGAQLDREGDDRARARRTRTSSGSRATGRFASTSRRCGRPSRTTCARAIDRWP